MDRETIEEIQNGKYWHRFWTIPNAFTMLRIASSVGLVSYLALQGLNPITCFGITSRFWLPSWAIMTAATDFVDGTLARSLHQQSKWGQALDPIADKVQNWGIALTLMASGVMPLWVLAIGVRDLAVGIFTAKKKYEDGKKQEEKAALKNQNFSNEKKESTLNKWKERYQIFKKGEAPSPTFPAKMKMALQSVGGIATLAFGFQVTNLSLLVPIMVGSAASMMIPDVLPLSDKGKKIAQFLSTLAVSSVGIVLGGVSMIAPIMMASAISMALPEAFAIKREYLNNKENHTKKEKIYRQVQPEMIHEEQTKTNEKQNKNTLEVKQQPKKQDYTEIDRWIENQMLHEHQDESQNSLTDGFQKVKRK